MFVLSDDSKFDSSNVSRAVTAADNTLKYVFAVRVEHACHIHSKAMGKRGFHPY